MRLGAAGSCGTSITHSSQGKQTHGGHFKSRSSRLGMVELKPEDEASPMLAKGRQLMTVLSRVSQFEGARSRLWAQHKIWMVSAWHVAAPEIMADPHFLHCCCHVIPQGFVLLANWWSPCGAGLFVMGWIFSSFENESF